MNLSVLQGFWQKRPSGACFRESPPGRAAILDVDNQRVYGGNYFCKSLLRMDFDLFLHSQKTGNDSVAQLVEQYTFNVWVLGSSPSGITERLIVRRFFVFGMVAFLICAGTSCQSGRDKLGAFILALYFCSSPSIFCIRSNSITSI